MIDFICEEINEGRAPSQSEIARDLEITRQGAAGHVRALVRKGWLMRRGRALVPTDLAWRRQVLRDSDRRARASLPRGVLSGGAARAIARVQSALRGMSPDGQQMVLDLAAR